MAPFFDSDKDDDESSTEARIYVHVKPAEGTSVLAMVDTAAPWCIFRPEVGRDIERYLEDLQPQRLGTRLGTFRGRLFRGGVRILALEGDPVDVEALIFLSPDWSGPNIIGYEGFLQKIRFAVDPYRNRFFFSSDY